MRDDKEDKSLNGLITVFGRRVYGTAFDLIENDPHQWSSRPCTTCNAISQIIGRPFGCNREAARK